MAPELRDGATRFAEIDWRGRPIRIEYQWVGVRDAGRPVVVFLHEGLGSIALWKDFPAAFCAANGVAGLVFSRYGYGRSTPRPADERWPVGFMHAQATEVLPAFLARLGLERPFLFGHSDGASISLLYAARFPDRVSGIAVAAPHIFVEDLTIDSIRAAREAYLHQGLRERLARYHDDVDSAFWGWNDIWLDPAFRAWNIESELSCITCPLMALQGADDEYGTLEQIYGIRKKAPQTELLVLPRCGHSPHRDQTDATVNEVGGFILRSI